MTKLANPPVPSRAKYKSSHVWARASRLKLLRTDTDGFFDDTRGLCELESGVNYFVLQLERLGAVTLYTCEGHPNGFYILFHTAHASANLVHDIAGAGFISVGVSDKPGTYRLNFHAHTSFKDEADRDETFRWAAKCWEKKLGRLVLPLGPEHTWRQDRIDRDHWMLLTDPKDAVLITPDRPLVLPRIVA